MDNSKQDGQVSPGTKKGVLAVERRKHQRFTVELPLDYSRVNTKELYGGVVANAGEGGILVYLPERIEVGAVLKIGIFYVNGFQLDTIQAIAKVVWSDLAIRGTLGVHRYGLQFQYIEEKEYQNLLDLLKGVGNF